MTDLYNPALPGSKFTTNATGWGRSGWVEWDQLTEEQQKAHEDVLAEREAAEKAGAAKAAPDVSLDLNDTEPSTAGPGDTPKE